MSYLRELISVHLLANKEDTKWLMCLLVEWINSKYEINTSLVNYPNLLIRNYSSPEKWAKGLLHLSGQISCTLNESWIPMLQDEHLRKRLFLRFLLFSLPLFLLGVCNGFRSVLWMAWNATKVGGLLYSQMESHFFVRWPTLCARFTLVNSSLCWSACDVAP